MMEPPTDELLGKLLEAPDPESFIDDNDISGKTLAGYLGELLEAKGLKRSRVIREANLNETFGYQIFMGQRNPSRDKVLQLAFAMQLDLPEANRLLKLAGANELYCKCRRDAIIIFCLSKRYPLHATDEELYRFGESTIC